MSDTTLNRQVTVTVTLETVQEENIPKASKAFVPEAHRSSLSLLLRSLHGCASGRLDVRSRPTRNDSCGALNASVMAELAANPSLASPFDCSFRSAKTFCLLLFKLGMQGTFR